MLIFSFIRKLNNCICMLFTICKLIINNESKFGVYSNYLCNKNWINSICHNFDQQQGQFRRSWTWLFFLYSSGFLRRPQQISLRPLHYTWRRLYENHRRCIFPILPFHVPRSYLYSIDLRFCRYYKHCMLTICAHQWAFLITIYPLSVVVAGVVVVVVVNFYSFSFFSRTIAPISTKLGTKYFWLKGINSSSNEGPRPFLRGDNNGLAKIPVY